MCGLEICRICRRTDRDGEVSTMLLQGTDRVVCCSVALLARSSAYASIQEFIYVIISIPHDAVLLQSSAAAGKSRDSKDICALTFQRLDRAVVALGSPSASPRMREEGGMLGRYKSCSTSLALTAEFHPSSVKFCIPILILAGVPVLRSCGIDNLLLPFQSNWKPRHAGHDPFMISA